MNYKPLKNQFLKLAPKGELVFDAGTGTVLIPPADTKVFLHWTNENGKLVSTYTLTYSTLVQNKFKIINGSDKAISIHAIDTSI
jgi:flagellar hook assembly protein FlgD